ncbi:hypothetical protein FRX31_026836 [Thalictrum thalictroides]|uniref:Uncharacterized protein n=1 Tax=Thalictrum thalictroides TaxID=46969 RepID=A0A7J6VEP7_THATH|nr:hypothetical protein FRX31_026836 [Thalictrum thalictroides]
MDVNQKTAIHNVDRRERFYGMDMATHGSRHYGEKEGTLDAHVSTLSIDCKGDPVFIKNIMVYLHTNKPTWVQPVLRQIFN